MNTSSVRKTLKIGIAMLALSSGVALAAQGLKAGDPLPPLKAPGIKGTVPVMTGKVVLLDFWASWCGPCRKSFPEMQALHKKYGPKGLVVLGVNVDKKAEDMERFLDQMETSFPVVRDSDQKYIAAAGITTMPTSILIDRKGAVRSIHKGFHGKESVDALEKEIVQLLEEKP